jgi:MFS family permease
MTPRRLRDLLVRYPDFRRLFLAMVISLIGDWFAFVAVSGLVTELTGRPGLPAFLYAASVLPVIFAAPLAGAIADRVDRRRMLVVADLLRIPPALGLCAAAMWGSAALAAGCMLLIGLISSFFDPVAAAATPNLVDDEDLPAAQVAVGAIWGSMLLVGAGLGGAVTALLGRQAAFLVNAASFALSALLVARIRRPLQERRAPVPSRGLRAEMGELRRFVRAHPLVRALLFSKAGVGSANGIVGLLPAFALGRFGAGDGGTGLLLAARGLGALIGPFAGHRLASGLGAQGSRGILLVCGASTLTFGLTYAFLPIAPSLAVAALCVLVAHLGGGAQWMLSSYGLQDATPDALRGRVMSIDYGIATCAIGLSAVVAGTLAELIGPAATTWSLVGVAIVYGTGWLAATHGLWRRGGAGSPTLGP